MSQVILERQFYLTDEVINRYLKLIMRRNPEVYAFDTFFFNKYCTAGFNGVKTWTKKVNIFNKSKLLIPINIVGNKGRFRHWALIYVNMETEQIFYYDSLKDVIKPATFMDKILKYLKEEHLHKLNSTLPNETGWKRLSVECPGQDNGKDCGVFLCVFAEYLTRGAVFNFTQDHMMSFRQLILHELTIQRLIDVNVASFDIDMFIQNAIHGQNN